jgi:hypothetical protein
MVVFKVLAVLAPDDVWLCGWQLLQKVDSVIRINPTIWRKLTATKLCNRRLSAD